MSNLILEAKEMQYDGINGCGRRKEWWNPSPYLYCGFALKIYLNEMQQPMNNKQLWMLYTTCSILKEGRI